jgi:exodeoxyribonuclease VII large subunit
MERVWSVSDLNKNIKAIIDSEAILHNVTLIGEISDYKVHNSGHIYLTLKDESSMIRATMWKSYAAKMIALNPKDGMKIKVIGNVSHYEKGGSLNFNITNVSLDGEGEAKRNYELLKKEFDSLGWFDAQWKKPINPCPQRIAIITAKEGDAIHDIVTNIRKKTKAVELFLFPALVQGDGSAKSIATQIKNVNEFHLPIDTIILGRGGGSYEHLAAFNERIVVEAMFKSKIPIVTGIGHDKDETIACFVSDLNCSTPTGAGSEAVMPVEEIKKLYNNKLAAAAFLLKEKLSLSKAKITNAFSIFSRELIKKLNTTREQISILKSGIQHSCELSVQRASQILYHIELETKNSLRLKLNNSILLINNLKELIEVHDVNKNLEKGYSVLLKNGTSIKSVNDLKIDDNIEAKVYDGKVLLKVYDIKKGE